MTTFGDTFRLLSSAQKSSKGVSLYSTYVNRPLGRICAAVAFVAGLSPTAVTVLSGFTTLVGVLVLMVAQPSILTGVAVWLLLALGFVLDSADGQVARLRGQTSRAGEWLDHAVDAAKMVLLHMAVLVGWFRFFDLDEAWLAVPLAYQVVAVVTFSGLTTVGLLKRGTSAGDQAPAAPAATTEVRPSVLRSVLLLPGDYGLLCLAFVLWGFESVFPWMYLVLLLVNALLMVAFLVKWYVELRQLDRPGPAPGPLEVRSRLAVARRVCVGGLLRCLPARSHAVVHGFPDHEGNSTEVLRHLLVHYPGRIYWLVSSIGDDRTWELDDLDLSRLVVLKKDSARAFRKYLSAELVFFTHGLYGSPEPPQNRMFVNLWHGDGPKRTGNIAFDAKIRSTLLVAGTQEFGARKAAGLGVPKNRLAVTGNPRIDQFGRPASDGQLRALGLEADRPLVVWAPTYRASAGGGGVAWSDSSRLTAHSQILEDVREAADALSAAGGQFIVKPHPLDADSFRRMGLPVVDDAQLVAARVSFYNLLARSAGLLTDYSSIWTDYLALERPVGYYCPDLEEYQRGRGFFIADFREWIAGPLIRDRDALVAYMLGVLKGQDPGAAERRAVAKRLGAVTALGATPRVMLATGHSALQYEARERSDA